jgi:hypothetical protein
VKLREVSGRLMEVGLAPLSAGDELSAVRFPPWHLEEGDGSNVCAGGRDSWLMGCTTAVDHRAALGGSYRSKAAERELSMLRCLGSCGGNSTDDLARRTALARMKMRTPIGSHP